jgi:hypothetical protein
MGLFIGNSIAEFSQIVLDYLFQRKKILGFHVF